MKKQFDIACAKVAWTPNDIQDLKPDWSDEQCYEFLINNQRHIQDRMIEYGWDVIRELINFEELE